MKNYSLLLFTNLAAKLLNFASSALPALNASGHLPVSQPGSYQSEHFNDVSAFSAILVL